MESVSLPNNFTSLTPMQTTISTLFQSSQGFQEQVADYTSYKYCLTSPWYSYYIGGLGTSLLCMFAIVGNIICILVLTQPVIRSPVNIILLSLSVSDLVTVIMSLLMRGIPRILNHFCIWKTYTNWFFPKATPYLFAIGTTAQVTSVYLTVLVCIERYLAVCKPFRVRRWCTIRKTFLACIGMFLFSTMYNLPTWLELDSRKRFEKDGTFVGYTVYKTKLYKDPRYVLFYVNWGSFIVIRVIPFAFLTVLYTLIYRAILEMNHKRQQLTQSQTQEIRIARMLSMIVLIFLCCNIVTIISHMLEAFGGPHPPELQAASNFLILLNAALNFVVYCIMNSSFRKVFVRYYCQWSGYCTGNEDDEPVTYSSYSRGGTGNRNLKFRTNQNFGQTFQRILVKSRPKDSSSFESSV